jgi:hypothetical protein
MISLACSQVRSHTSQAEEYGRSTPTSTRLMQVTTTTLNEIETMRWAYGAFCQTASKLRRVKGLMFPFVFQAMSPGWMHKGGPSTLSFEECTEPLVILNCSVTFADTQDDERVRYGIR